jgi:hypothetical protein
MKEGRKEGREGREEGRKGREEGREREGRVGCGVVAEYWKSAPKKRAKNKKMRGGIGNCRCHCLWTDLRGTERRGEKREERRREEKKRRREKRKELQSDVAECRRQKKRAKKSAPRLAEDCGVETCWR